MPGIFICYRRQDSLREARAVYERLRAEFGHDQVFIDLESLDYGEDFVESIERQLARCEVMLALIGPTWLNTADGHGGRHIDNENDYVRIELRAALARNIRVVPVLLDGTPLPRTVDLPPDLQKLLRRQALALDFHRFDADIGRLVASLRRVAQKLVESSQAAAQLVQVPAAITKHVVAEPPAPKQAPSAASATAPTIAAAQHQQQSTLPSTRPAAAPSEPKGPKVPELPASTPISTPASAHPHSLAPSPAPSSEANAETRAPSPQAPASAPVSPPKPVPPAPTAKPAAEKSDPPQVSRPPGQGPTKPSNARTRLLVGAAGGLSALAFASWLIWGGQLRSKKVEATAPAASAAPSKALSNAAVAPSPTASQLDAIAQQRNAATVLEEQRLRRTQAASTGEEKRQRDVQEAAAEKAAKEKAAKEVAARAERERAAKASQTIVPFTRFRDCDSDICPWMIALPAGSFMMGSPASEVRHHEHEGPQHRVDVPAFAIGQTEVTFAQWDGCVQAGGCKRRPDDQTWGRGQRPVINVNLNDAKEYATWLSARTGQTYRLPSEAEWEYAARSGTSTPFAFGDRISTDQANFDGSLTYNGSDTGEQRAKTLPVGSLKANAWQLYDMHGNVYEWVQDCWHDNYSGAPVDGSAWTTGCTGKRGIVRGGGWYVDPMWARSANRFRYPPGDWTRDSITGFRIVRTHH